MTLALITGGSGHAGAALQRELLNQGYKVRCIDFDKDHRAYEGLEVDLIEGDVTKKDTCLLYTSPSPRDKRQSRMPSSA